VATRPIAVWLYPLLLVVWVVWSASENLEVARQRLVSPLGALAVFVPFLLGAIGFWFMRWWSVVVLVATGVIAVVTWPDELFYKIIAAAVVVGPAPVIALVNRGHFRWW